MINRAGREKRVLYNKRSASGVHVFYFSQKKVCKVDHFLSQKQSFAITSSRSEGETMKLWKRTSWKNQICFFNLYLKM
jgi:hypothetical protein